MKGEAFPKVISIQRLEMWVTRAYSGGQVVKNLPARHEPQEIPAQCLCLENHLEESMAIHSNILDWRIPQTEELGGLQSIVSQIVGHDWNNIAHAHTHTHTHTRIHIEGECIWDFGTMTFQKWNQWLAVRSWVTYSYFQEMIHNFQTQDFQAAQYHL